MNIRIRWNTSSDILHFCIWTILIRCNMSELWLGKISATWKMDLPCHIHFPVCLWIMDPHSRAPKKNTSHGNEVLLQGTTHLIQRPCYQRGSSYQDPAGNWTTRRPDYHKETQTAVVLSYLSFIRFGQNHFARHSEKGKKTRQTEEEVERHHQGMDRPGFWQVPEGSGNWKNRENWLQNHLWCPNDPRS